MLPHLGRGLKHGQQVPASLPCHLQAGIIHAVWVLLKT